MNLRIWLNLKNEESNAIFSIKQWSVYFKKTDPYPYILKPDSILFSKDNFLSVLKISKTFDFFLRTPSEYLTRYGQGSAFKIRSQGSLSIFLKKKTKVIDIFNMDKNVLWKLIYIYG